jgi:hypothetical protein
MCSVNAPTVIALAFFNLCLTIASWAFAMEPCASISTWVAHHHHPVHRVFGGLWLANCQDEIKMVSVDSSHVRLWSAVCVLDKGEVIAILVQVMISVIMAWSVQPAWSLLYLGSLQLINLTDTGLEQWPLQDFLVPKETGSSRVQNSNIVEREKDSNNRLSYYRNLYSWSKQYALMNKASKDRS